MSTELATRGTDALTIAQHLGSLKELGKTLIESGLLPRDIRKPESAVAIILKGRELGLPPMQALSHINIINGKPSLSAEVMLAMALERGHRVALTSSDGQQATITGQRLESANPRQYGPEQSLTFTMQEAQQAGVTSNQTWKKYPAAMLRARAISAFMRMFAPDVLMGASYVPEELGADVNEDGEVIDAPARPAPKPPERARPAPEPEPEVTDAAFEAVPMITAPQTQALAIAIGTCDFGMDDAGREKGRAFVSHLAGINPVESIKDLTRTQAATVLDKLGTGENGKYQTDDVKLAEALHTWLDLQRPVTIAGQDMLPIDPNDTTPPNFEDAA